ncbi:MAG: hypothetical protein Q8L10_05145 [Candidatus Moranbacteria bacterium]|nr:hypothetical protein [Candidatus Moranbacteria bacterium]
MFFQDKKHNKYSSNVSDRKRGFFASRSFFSYRNKKRILNGSFALLVIFSLAGGMYFNSQKAQGVDFTFTQADWSGGQSDITATHTDDQTGWTKYGAKDPAMVNGASNLQLDLPSFQETFTSDADFATGTDSDTQVSGAGDEAMVGLLNTNEVIQVSTGYYHACALKTDGTVFCWGVNNYGQLGDFSTTQRLTPVQVHGVNNVGVLTDVSHISAGGYHTCALKTDNSVYCWGYNSTGQIGDYTVTQRLTPVQVHGVDNVGVLTDVNRISAGGVHTCAIKTDGAVYCWGSNVYGRLGDNTITQRTTPVQVHGVSDVGFLVDVDQIIPGINQTCALKIDGTVYCWGINNYGQIGDGTIIESHIPVQVHGVNDSGFLSDISLVASGQNHNCALKTDNTVYCWGYNGAGQLGDNTTTARYTPVQVHGVNDVGVLTDVNQISTKFRHTCATKNDGTVYCWGYGVYGQLGNFSNVTSFTPVQVHGIGNIDFLSSANQISTGYHHTCALKTGGVVNCWGYNSNGQLGDSTTTQSNVPVQTLNLVTYLSSGTHTSVATDLSTTKDFTTLSFNKNVPANTTLTVDVRAGNTADPDDGSWVAWQNDIADGGNISALNGNRYVQYRANLATTDIATTPSLSDITFHFTARQTLTSSVYNTEVAAATLASLQWSENLLPNTDIQFQLRTSGDGLAWGPWCGPEDGTLDTCDSDAYFTDSGNEAIDDIQKDRTGDQYFQYQATLSSSDGLNTPTLSGVTVSYATINAPAVATVADPTVASFSATASGNLTATGGENPTRYIQYGTVSGVYPDQCSANTGTTGIYSCQITDLTPETTYYYRAKAVNSVGEAVGSELSFTTLPESVVIPEPDEVKITDAEDSDYFALDSGTLTATEQATANLNITLTTDIGQAYLPLNTVITNTDGGTFDLSKLDITNVTSSVRSTIATSRGAIEIGVPDTRLTFTNNPITISIAIDPVYNGDSLAIQSKSAGSSDWVDEGSCVVTSGLCTFTTTQATTYTVNGDGSLSGETNINSSLPIEATIALSCTDTLTLNPITGTGQSAIDAANEATCNIKTNNSNGYKLEWSTPNTDLTNATADTIAGYLPTTPDTPEIWTIDQATAAWGARLKSTSTDPDTNLWGTSDGYAGKWLNVSAAAYQIIVRSTETLQTGSDQIIQFGSEIGSNKFQPTGTYTGSVVMTATTL